MKEIIYGCVEYEGKTLYMTQNPFASSRTDRLTEYEAAAKDDEGNCYNIFWPIVDEFAEDESDACDWEDYEVEPWIRRRV